VRAASVALASLAILFATMRSAWPETTRPAELAPAPVREADAGAGLVALRAPGSERILVRGGAFLMGSTAADVASAVALCRAERSGEDCKEEAFAHEYPQHEVLLRDYWLDRTEVTVERYGRCIAAGRCKGGPFVPGAERFQAPSLPAVLVTWSEAAAYCAWTGARLPTEAEWERAARGRVGRAYPWGNVPQPDLANHGRFALRDWTNLDASDGFTELAPVGSYPRGRTPDGFDDLAGNVEEWVGDWYASEYPATSEIDPKGPPTGDFRVLRGGNYVYGLVALRGAFRAAAPPSDRTAYRGFRCASDAR
jgi:formylglycine-generating enzyme required for sulfatase activity